eukprot:10449859-Alexandrium_andersonii.AAC.1
MVEVPAAARRPPLACPRARVWLDALLGKAPQPAAPWVLLEGWALVPVEPGLSEAAPIITVRGALAQSQESKDVSRVCPGPERGVGDPAMAVGLEEAHDGPGHGWLPSPEKVPRVVSRLVPESPAQVGHARACLPALGPWGWPHQEALR